MNIYKVLGGYKYIDMNS